MTKKQRHIDTAREFQEWLEKNPNTTHGEKFDAFDRIADSRHKIVQRKLRERRNQQALKRV